MAREKIADRLGKISTLEDVIDAIEIALTWHEIVGRPFRSCEIETFQPIEIAFGMPSIRAQCRHLDSTAQDRVLEQMATLSDLLNPKDGPPTESSPVPVSLSLFSGD